MHAAVSLDRASVVESLIRLGTASLHRSGAQLFQLAFERDNSLVAELLFAAGASVAPLANDWPEQVRVLLAIPAERQLALRHRIYFSSTLLDVLLTFFFGRMTAESAAEAVERLGRDATLQRIDLSGKRHTDDEFAELADRLLAHPDVLSSLFICNNRLTDQTGVKLARYIAASSTLRSLNLGNNYVGEATYLAVAAALRVNKSLNFLCLIGNQEVDKTSISATFVDALRLNPNRSTATLWWLFSFADEYRQLKPVAEQLGHPSLQMLLAMHDFTTVEAVN